MCIICIKPQGVKLPSYSVLSEMFKSNPHGAGYMYARAGRVYIRKGFMTFYEFYSALQAEKLTRRDTVIYHFRISTQAGVCPEMCHPFKLTSDITETRDLIASAGVGIAHNGIISLCADSSDKLYSDTAHFIAEYLHKIIKAPADIHDINKLKRIEMLARSKFAFLNGAGEYSTVGDFNERDGLLFSNYSYLPRLPVGSYIDKIFKE